MCRCSLQCLNMFFKSQHSKNMKYCRSSIRPTEFPLQSHRILLSHKIPEVFSTSCFNSMNHIFLNSTNLMNDWSRIMKMDILRYFLTINPYYTLNSSLDFAKVTFHIFCFVLLIQDILDSISSFTFDLSTLQLIPT